MGTDVWIVWKWVLWHGNQQLLSINASHICYPLYVRGSHMCFWSWSLIVQDDLFLCQLNYSKKKTLLALINSLLFHCDLVSSMPQFKMALRKGNLSQAVFRMIWEKGMRLPWFPHAFPIILSFWIPISFPADQPQFFSWLSFIALPHRFNDVSVVFTFNVSLNDFIPLTPILLSVNQLLVSFPLSFFSSS